MKCPPRNNIRACAILSLLAVFPCTEAVSSDLNFDPVRPEIVSPAAAGSGGSYCANVSGFDTLSTNPAGLAYVSEELSISRVAAHVSGPLFDLASTMQSSDIASGLLDLVGKNNGINMGAEVTGPISFGKVDRNFGFGLFNRTLVSADIPSLASARLLGGEEFLLTGGYGLTVYEKGPHSIAVGLQLKGFIQSFLYEKDTAVEVIQDATNLKVNNLPAALSTGFGLDAGVMYRSSSGFSAGLTCKDLYTPVFTTGYDSISDFMKGTSGSDTSTDILSPYLSAGVSYSIPLPSSWVTITDWKLMADYRDILDILNPVYRNPILNVAFGTELVLIDVVSLRAGISETYLSTGLGVDLHICEIDLAMYGSELGLDPGKRPLLNIALGVSFEY